MSREQLVSSIPSKREYFGTLRKKDLHFELRLSDTELAARDQFTHNLHSTTENRSTLTCNCKSVHIVN